MRVIIRQQAFDPWSELADYRRRIEEPGQAGACAVFAGTMRDFNEGDAVSSMNLEHYPGMTERQLGKILEVQIREHGLLDAMVIHRVGHIEPGETIVLAAAWSTHRKQAFDACRQIMEDLKHSAPFWKQEHTARGGRWVETNTPG